MSAQNHGWDGVERRKDSALGEQLNELTQQLNTININIVSLTSAVNNDRENNTRYFKDLFRKTAFHDVILIGDNDHTGIKEELNTIKRRQAASDKVLITVGLASVSSIVSLAWQWFTKKVGL